MARLVILGGRHEGKRLRLPVRELTIGRNDDCHVTLRTSEVSRKHCVIRVESEDDVFVRDLQSANGTLVNDVTITTEVRLNHGDLMTVGPVSFRLELVTAPKGMQAPSEEFPAGAEDEDDSVDATENSIASWLTNGEPADTTSDTAIMKSGDSRVPKMDPLSDSTVQPLRPLAEPSTTVSSSPSKFDSVAEEAEDIIRRHREEKKRLKQARKKS